MKKLSVVISAFNEEKKIQACLESAKFADEIIFVDNSSTDKTLEIAKKYTKKVYIQKNNPAKIDLQKNFGIEKATGDWILILDSDEVITQELSQAIQQVMKSKEPADGYFIPRKNIIFGKWIQHSGWYPDYQLRLFLKGKGRYQQQHYHEPITVEGETEELKENLLHYNYESIRQFLHKSFQVYAPNESENFLRKGYVFDYKDAVRFPLNEFISRYFARNGYKDGYHGLMLSLLMAVYYFAIFCYLWEKEKFVDKNMHDLEFFENTLQKSNDDIRFWLDKEKIEEEENAVKRGLLIIKRKLHKL